MSCLVAKEAERVFNLVSAILAAGAQGEITADQALEISKRIIRLYDEKSVYAMRIELDRTGKISVEED